MTTINSDAFAALLNAAELEGRFDGNLDSIACIFTDGYPIFIEAKSGPLLIFSKEYHHEEFKKYYDIAKEKFKD